MPSRRGDVEPVADADAPEAGCHADDFIDRCVAVNHALRTPRATRREEHELRVIAGRKGEVEVPPAGLRDGDDRIAEAASAEARQAGTRTRLTWMDRIRDALQAAGFRVELAGY